MEIFTSSETMVNKQLNMALTNMAMKYVFKITAEHTTMAVFPQPEEWFAATRPCNRLHDE